MTHSNSIASDIQERDHVIGSDSPTPVSFLAIAIRAKLELFVGWYSYMTGRACGTSL